MSLWIRSAAVAVLLSSSLAWAQGATSAPLTTDQIREAIQAQLPVPLEGFVWKLFKNAVFVKPVGWHEQQATHISEGVPISVYEASPQKMVADKDFDLGLRVQIISGSKRLRGIDSKQIVLIYMKPYLDSHKNEDVLLFKQSVRGDFQQTLFRYRDATPGLKPIMVHKFILANEVTDTVHVFTFTSPTASWDDNWAKSGAQILSTVNIMPGVPAH